MRHLLVLVACLVMWNSTARADAEQNPLLAAIAQVDPAKWATLKGKLEALTTTGTRDTTQRKGMGPTDDEAAQIRANPVLSRAFVHAPAGTLSLLREINDGLASKRGAALPATRKQ